MKKFDRIHMTTGFVSICAIGMTTVSEAQYIVIPAQLEMPVGEGRELSGSVQGYPKRAEWYTSDSGIADLSYPISLHYRPPASGQPHIAHPIRVDCRSNGQAKIDAVPIDRNLQSVSVQVDCKPKKVEGGGPIVSTNPEDCIAPGAGEILKWKTPIDGSNFPNCGGANTNCNVVVGKTICAAVNSFVSVRMDGKLCSNCHFQGSGSTYSPSVRQDSTGGIAKDDFQPIYADSFQTKDNMASPAYKPTYLRNLMEKWERDGYE
ncbi:MAG: hypothetical protein LJE91_05675 [Gammaproteobacteria bacterium]|jgi:hypothetical protein|nr:hypothetical protein [Gammaproteobacteria bacterium]